MVRRWCCLVVSGGSGVFGCLRGGPFRGSHRVGSRFEEFILSNTHATTQGGLPTVPGHNWTEPSQVWWLPAACAASQCSLKQQPESWSSEAQLQKLGKVQRCHARVL